MEKSRRKFMRQNLLAGIGISSIIKSVSGKTPIFHTRTGVTPAILGGKPSFPAQRPKWPGWPIWVAEDDEPEVLEVLRSGVWSRSKVVRQLAEGWAELEGA